MTRGGSTVAAILVIVLLARIARDLGAAQAQNSEGAATDAPTREVG